MKTLSAVFVLIMMTLQAFSQNGTVVESIAFKSKSGETMKYSVYLPANYTTSQRSYPVVYLLHGYSDDETGWIQFGEADQIVNKGIVEGKFPACILVIPDGKVTWYCNSYDRKITWEDTFIQEFIPYVEKEYRIRAKKEFRAIAGLSMGGYGALKLSMKHSDLFGSCDLLHSVPLEKLKSVRFWIDCGDDDFLCNGNSALHVEMRKIGLPHEYRVRDGGHTWSYWRSGLATGLEFIGEKFHR